MFTGVWPLVISKWTRLDGVGRVRKTISHMEREKNEKSFTVLREKQDRNRRGKNGGGPGQGRPLDEHGDDAGKPAGSVGMFNGNEKKRGVFEHWDVVGKRGTEAHTDACNGFVFGGGKGVRGIVEEIECVRDGVEDEADGGGSDQVFGFGNVGSVRFVGRR